MQSHSCARRTLAAVALGALVLAVAVGSVWAHENHGGHEAQATPAPSSQARSNAPAETAARPPGALLGGAILLCGLGGVLGGRRLRRTRLAPLAGATAVVLVGFTFGLAPHLVHHAFDPDQGAGCDVQQTGDRGPGELVVPTPIPAPWFAAWLPSGAPPAAPAHVRFATPGRSPPPSPLT